MMRRIGLHSFSEKQGKIIEFEDLDYAVYFGGVIEFGKVLTTNLLLINAGGLVAVPAYAQLFQASKTSPFLILGVPAIIFACGLISAGLSGVCSYYSYLDSSHKILYERRAFRIAAPGKKRPATARDELQRISEKISRLERSIRTKYRGAHILGWLSLSCFLLACFYFGITALIWRN